MTNCQRCDAHLPSAKRSGRERKWCSERCRKAQYDLQCIVCNGRVDGTTPSKTDLNNPVCRKCAPNYYRIWNREAIVCAIQEWADQNGGIPPAATDWNPNQAVRIGRPEKAAKFRADGCWPNVSTIQLYFRTWNSAIEAAGFEPRGPGQYGRDGENPAIVREIAEKYKSGISGWQLAKDYDCSSEAIYYRLDKAGVERRQPAWKQAA